MAFVKWERPKPLKTPPAVFTMTLTQAEAEAIFDVLDCADSQLRSENEAVYDVIERLDEALADAEKQSA